MEKMEFVNLQKDVKKLEADVSRLFRLVETLTDHVSRLSNIVMVLTDETAPALTLEQKEAIRNKKS